MAFSKYYQSELAYLREMGRVFGESNPTIAGLLAERGTDPDVERLLEGFAFLTARIRERIDDAVPEIIHALAELLAPHYLRPIPATTIVEFQPQAGALRGRHTVARGAPLGADPVGATSCQFRTCADTDLLPLLLEEVQLDDSRLSAPVIRLRFRCADKGLPSVFEPAGIRLFFAGEYAVGATLFAWFLRHCRQVKVSSLIDDSHTEPVSLDPQVIKPAGFSPDSSLFPWSRFVPHGVRLLHEYFTQPSKFLFVDITGLDAAVQAAAERFEIAFTFERPPALPAQLGQQSIRLHCAPAANLFTSSAKPIKKSAIEHEHLLTASDVNPEHMEVYSIDTVRALGAGRGGAVEYEPFVAFSHAAANKGNGSFYQVRRRNSPIDGGVDTYFSIVSPRNQPPDTGQETFSIEATFTNRFLPRELLAGSVCIPVTGSPSVASFNNIAEVTNPCTPPLGAELYWRLLSHVGLNHASLADAEALRAFLDIYNIQGLSNQALGRVNRLRVESIHSVETRAARRVLGGMPVRGGHTHVTLVEDKLASEGDAFLFGCVLNELCADRVSINAFSELSVKLHQSQGEYHWQARAGQQTII